MISPMHVNLEVGVLIQQSHSLFFILTERNDNEISCYFVFCVLFTYSINIRAVFN